MTFAGKTTVNPYSFDNGTRLHQVSLVTQKPMYGDGTSSTRIGCIVGKVVLAALGHGVCGLLTKFQIF